MADDLIHASSEVKLLDSIKQYFQVNSCKKSSGGLWWLKISGKNFGEKLQFCSVRKIEVGKRSTLVVSELREVAGVGRKMVEKQRGGGHGTPNSENRLENIFGGI